VLLLVRRPLPLAATAQVQVAVHDPGAVEGAAQALAELLILRPDLAFPVVLATSEDRIRAADVGAV